MMRPRFIGGANCARNVAQETSTEVGQVPISEVNLGQVGGGGEAWFGGQVGQGEVGLERQVIVGSPGNRHGWIGQY